MVVGVEEGIAPNLIFEMPALDARSWGSSVERGCGPSLRRRARKKEREEWVAVEQLWWRDDRGRERSELDGEERR